METTADIFLLFDQSKNNPTEGHYLVEGAKEVTLLLDKEKEDANNLYLSFEFLDSLGTFAVWKKEGFHGFQCSIRKPTDNSLFDSELFELYIFTPFYLVDEDNTLYNYLLLEMLNPLDYEIGVDCFFCVD